MIFAVFIGGGIGAVCRYILSVCLKGYAEFFPIGTLVANFSGCLIAGMALTYFTLKADLNPAYKALIITGFCGGLTTFSTFSLETISMIQTGNFIKALIYTLISAVLCLISASLGVFIIKRLFSV